MVTKLNELLGEELLQHNASGDELSVISTNQLDGKTIVVFFAAHSCTNCKDFTPRLVKAFNEVNDEIKNKLDIVFISCDKNSEDSKEYFKKMPWKALPFSDRHRSTVLSEEFNTEDIPSLIVLSPSCELITSNGYDEICYAPKVALHKWSQGKCLFWTREQRDNEHVWESINCSKCFMKPLIGSRYGCTNHECQINLCETCSSKNKHEHPLVEYLIPTQEYSLETLLTSIPYLLDPKSEEKIETKTILKNDIKCIGFYFSAQWYSDCRIFTIELAELYKKSQANSHPFHIVFVSCDDDEESFHSYRSEMPWPAVPWNSSAILKAYFQAFTIPLFIIVSSDGKILSRRGYENVLRLGIEALQTWSQGEKLPRLSEDKYKWLDITCDGCHMNPLVGQRYSCSMCDYYNFCSACEKKGHKHPLVLQPQPNDDE
ncbi:unnamed protein product [Rotaria sp. Silwood2]|nr:unnamed protein product [Rotaria sp. Silwood2]CAF2693222.1 unnamed protein product [Rotaria sp. Silwood2]CAF2938532.1 unnamed protein product [Rotaria sp. Silwood2]CAF3088168.1 unnamed protein product [Rotaria sp. Silwood2]CAF4039464.1 unnamed protein product [Rotaria sp. Silwood2]